MTPSGSRSFTSLYLRLTLCDEHEAAATMADELVQIPLLRFPFQFGKQAVDLLLGLLQGA